MTKNVSTCWASGSQAGCWARSQLPGGWRSLCWQLVWLFSPSAPRWRCWCSSVALAGRFYLGIQRGNMCSAFVATKQWIWRNLGETKQNILLAWLNKKEIWWMTLTHLAAWRKSSFVSAALVVSQWQDWKMLPKQEEKLHDKRTSSEASRVRVTSSTILSQTVTVSVCVWEWLCVCTSANSIPCGSRYRHIPWRWLSRKSSSRRNLTAQRERQSRQYTEISSSRDCSTESHRNMDVRHTDCVANVLLGQRVKDKRCVRYPVQLQRKLLIPGLVADRPPACLANDCVVEL